MLSDIIIKRIANGETKEYHAHKAVLCMESSYFLKAFTGGFREASDAVIELHDDDPTHFELLLKYIYTYNYDKAAIDKLAAGNETKRVLVLLGIYEVADKYDVPCLYEAIVEDMREQLSSSNIKLLSIAIDAHYKTTAKVGGVMGKFIASVVLTDSRVFCESDSYKNKILANSTFGADMALAIARDMTTKKCRACNRFVVMRREHVVIQSAIYCPLCRTKMMA